MKLLNLVRFSQIVLGGEFRALSLPVLEKGKKALKELS